MTTRKGLVMLLVLVAFGALEVKAQNIYRDNASDPVSMMSHASLDFETFIFHNEAQFYSLRPSYYYGLKNERLLFGMTVPVVHNVFKGDYAGFENTTGIGDIRMSGLFVPFVQKNTIGLERITMALDISAPTGEYLLGRGAGTWLYKPGIVFTYRPMPQVAFYPELRYQFSGSEANSRGGIDGLPDTETAQKDDKIRNLSLALPMIAQLEDWDGWFGINILYTRSFVEKTDFLFLRTDFGKMIGNRSAASLRISKFVAGQPRLNVIVQANFSFFVGERQ